jgi:hypothetical protein
MSIVDKLNHFFRHLEAPRTILLAAHAKTVVRQQPTVVPEKMSNASMGSVGRQKLVDFHLKGKTSFKLDIRDLTILGRQREGDGQNKLLQINGSKDSSWYIINRMTLIQF